MQSWALGAASEEEPVTSNDSESTFQTRSLRQTRPSLSFLAVLLPLCVPLVSLAQERYSTDSLMAAFENASKTSIRGTEITLTGEIVESKKSRMIFKSSRNDKVICELASPINGGIIIAGGSITVVGRVRGRGLLGNVTLDECRLTSTPSVEAIASTATVEEPATVEPPNEPTEAATETPLVNKDAEAPTPDAPKVSSTSPSPNRLASTPAPRVTSIPDDSKRSEELEPSVKVLESSQAGIQQGSTSRKPFLLNHSYVLGGVLIVVSFLAVVILRPAFKDRFGTHSDASSSPEMRRVALEALLSAEKKKK